MFTTQNNEKLKNRYMTAVFFVVLTRRLIYVEVLEGFVDEIKIWINVIIAVGNMAKQHITNTLNAMIPIFHLSDICVIHVLWNSQHAKAIQNLVQGKEMIIFVTVMLISKRMRRNLLPVCEVAP